MVSIKRLPLISLFAGAGGLDLGLEQAGFTSIVANELEPYACETLRKNKDLCNLSEAEVDDFVLDALRQKCYRGWSSPKRASFFDRIKTRPSSEKYLQECQVIEGDIRDIPSATFQQYIADELFCIAGGPPCQPFSKAGKQKSLDCTKNGDLFFEFVRLVRELRPKWFIFENVKGMTFTKTDVIYQVCNNCGTRSIAPFPIRQDFANNSETIPCINCNSSNTFWHTINEKGGSLKIIVNEFEKVGYHCQFEVLNAADFGAPQIRERLFIVGSSTPVPYQWPKPTHSKSTQNQYQMTLFDAKVNSQPWISISSALWSETHPIYGSFDKEAARLWVKNVVRPHDEPVTWSLDRPSPTIGAHQAAKLAFAPFGVPEEQIFRQQWATEGRKQGDTPPVSVEHEYLSDAELLKLQTFPDWWYLHGTRMQRAFQIGNAVPPILAKAVGCSVIEADRKSKIKDGNTQSIY